MKEICSFFALALSLSFHSQTKLIAFKSHSGASSHFANAVSEDLFTTNLSNLGAIPQKFVKDAKLDSVIILNDEESILVTSAADKIILKNATREWVPGRETVRNNSLFSKKNIDSVKQVLKKQYHFVNDMDSVVFIEYDKQSKTYKEIKPVKEKKEKEKKGKTPGGLLLGILLISGVSGFYTWKKNKKDHGQ
ncbi:hypothetical protein [Chryseobacterium sp.]|uniref:hypothetical protein n=1 Tax=Chryseobacterium sp. TaxID=1871047 RepID=UPI00289BD806|nr:hypothetical protein [Chryseobacterium sp.]